MIGIDTNILVYAHHGDSPLHLAAKGCIQTLANREPWAVPWPCVHEFIAVVTNRKVFSRPSPLETALAQVDLWLQWTNLRLIGETPRHWEELKRLLVSGKIVGGMVHDARIAAICLQHGVRELWTADRDFSRFTGLATRNPLFPV